MQKRTYADEFKAEAVQLVTVHGLAPSRAASQVGVDENVLNRWIAKAVVGGQVGEAAQPDPSRVEPPEPDAVTQENIRLRQELASTHAELTRVWDFVHRITAQSIHP
jgi:transposase-like protein